MIDKIITFEQDTAERKRWFTAASFSHPAKMHLSLQMYLIEHYSKPGDTILDPMTGSGTILVACALGRNVICVELEEKFIKMQKDNWEKIKALGPMLGYKMGEAVILQGDARQLDNVLADCAIFSPPYAEALDRDEHKHPGGRVAEMLSRSYLKSSHGRTEGQIANLPYGSIPVVISSPPFGEAEFNYKHGMKKTTKNFKGRKVWEQHFRQQTSKNNIGNLPYGKADVVCTSPPYERSGVAQLPSAMGTTHRNLNISESRINLQYSDDNENIGNLKSENYLQAMLLVYQNCHRVLKEKGLMILVVKNFIRDKKIVQLDLDTIKLCEQAGFALIERLKRKLTQMSFWRRLYQQKYPDAPTIDFEDVLIFERTV